MKTNEKEMDAFEIFKDDEIKNDEIEAAEKKLHNLEKEYTNIVAVFGENSIPSKLWEELELAKNKLKMLQEKEEKENHLKEAINQLVSECGLNPNDIMMNVIDERLLTNKVTHRSLRGHIDNPHYGIKFSISRIDGCIDCCFSKAGAVDDTLIIRFCPDKRDICFDISQTKDWKIHLEESFRKIHMNFEEQAEIIYMIRLIRETLFCHGYRSSDKFGF